MIHPENPQDLQANEPEMHESVVQFSTGIMGAAPKYIPAQDHLLLDYQKPTKVGLIELPNQLKTPETIACPVLAVGPTAKNIKPGQRVVVLTKALIGGPNGLLVDGRPVFITTEPMVICTIE